MERVVDGRVGEAEDMNSQSSSYIVCFASVGMARSSIYSS
jgi:hypothetical protein